VLTRGSQDESKEQQDNENASEDSSTSLLEEVENLKDSVEELQIQLGKNQDQFDRFSKSFMSKANESTMAYYLKKIAESLHKECGEKPHSSCAESGIANSSVMNELYQSEDSNALKESAQRFYDKFQIVGMNLVNFKKYKKQSAQQIYSLEEKAKKTVTSETFKSEIDEIEKRLNGNFDVKVMHM